MNDPSSLFGRAMYDEVTGRGSRDDGPGGCLGCLLLVVLLLVIGLLRAVL